MKQSTHDKLKLLDEALKLLRGVLDQRHRIFIPEHEPDALHNWTERASDLCAKAGYKGL